MIKKLWIILLLYSSITYPSNRYLGRCIEKAEGNFCYAKSYIIGTVLAASGYLHSPELGGTTTGVAIGYGGYTWLAGWMTVKKIAKRYEPLRITEIENKWAVQKKRRFRFWRWRLAGDAIDVAQDGYYFENTHMVELYQECLRTKFLHDIYAKNIYLINARGKRIFSPKPEQVIEAIDREIAIMHTDLNRLKEMTNVAVSYADPHDFKEIKGIKTWLFPNYNRATRLYISIVNLIKRLEAIKELVVRLRTEVGGNGWPTVQRIEVQ